MAGRIAPCAKETRVTTVPAALSVFRVGADGRLDFVRKYDVDRPRRGPSTGWG